MENTFQRQDCTQQGKCGLAGSTASFPSRTVISYRKAHTLFLTWSVSSTLFLKVFSNMFGCTAMMILLSFKSLLICAVCTSNGDIYSLHELLLISFHLLQEGWGSTCAATNCRVDWNRLLNKKGSSALLFQAETDKEADNIRNWRPSENSSSDDNKAGPAQIVVTVSKTQLYCFLDGQEAIKSFNVLLCQYKDNYRR